MKHWFIAMAPHTWGRGHTVDEAKKEMRRAGATGTAWIVYLMPNGAKDPAVDGMGTMVWTWEDGADRHGRVEEVARGRGIKKLAKAA